MAAGDPAAAAAAAEADPVSRPRRRQANGRPNRVRINVTDEQISRWRTEAASDQVTLPRWVVERVDNRPPTMLRRALHTEIAGIRYEIAKAMANLNQVAAVAHTSGVDPVGWLASVAAIARQT